MISMRRATRAEFVVLSGVLIAALLVGLDLQRRGYSSAPQSSAVSSDLAGGWVPFGGAWRSEGQDIIGDSEDRGPKLMNGSLNWQNYFVETDVRLLGTYGDAGIIIRSSGEEEGVDSYHGYFAGVRSMDNSFLLGRADYGWDLFVLKPIPKVDGWYHIKLLVYGCSIAAAVTNAAGLNERSYVTDPQCITKGRFGLKSYGTSAEWRNLRVGSTDSVELKSFTQGIQPTVVNYNSDAPESDFSTSALDQFMNPLRREAEEHKFHLTTRPVGSLGFGDTKDSDHVTIRGIVTIVRPVLYVQDPTGAILLKSDGPVGPVRVGDEVEAQGIFSNDGFSPVLGHASVQLLWPDSQILPIVVTPFELAAGRNNGRFVETDGILLSQSVIANRFLLLKMENDSQEFYAIAGSGDAGSSATHIEPGSRLRLRGVASSDPAFTNNLVPFAVLLPSWVNVQVIGPPPWWTPIHTAFVLALVLLLAGAIHLSLSHVQRWRHEVVLRERERMALEVHDTLAQSFAGIGFQLQAMRADAIGNEPMQKQLEAALNMVRRSHKEAKKSFATIDFDIDCGPNIADSLRKVAEHLSAGRGLAIHAASQGSTRKIPKSVAETMFRIGQEAIYNCVRHSGATQVDIGLDIQRDTARLIVKDNGCGFIVDAGNYGFGLRGMSQRAANVSAHLEILSSPGEGTTVLIIAPIDFFSAIPPAGMRWYRQIFESKVNTTYGKSINLVRHSNPHR
jgi:signal transduction histidine kinase